MDYLLLVVGLGLLLLAANYLVDSSVAIAQRAKISNFIIGLTIVGIGTSAPELFVSISSALSNSGDIAMGNVVGSNIANIFLILGVTATILPFPIERLQRLRDIPFLIAMTILVMALANDAVIPGLDQNSLNRIDGIFLLILFVGYMCWVIVQKGKDPKKAIMEADEEAKSSLAGKSPWLLWAIAVVSLVADDEALFGEEGMYVTGSQYDDWYLNGAKGDRPTANFDVKGTECEVSVEYFGDGKKLTFLQKGGLRIQGGSTRWLPMKRFSVFSRKEYSGRSTFPVELFKGKATHSVVFNAGFENALSMYTVPDRDVATVQCIPVTVYLNGEYWYDTYMQEKYNNTYFRQTFGVENVEFVKVGITDEMKRFLEKHDLSDPKNYEAFGKMIDIQSYIDYICANVYLGNTDYNEYANTAMWRTVSKENDSYGDGRWRWAFYDMDLQTAGCRYNYGMNDITDAQLDTYNIVCDWDPPVNERQIYCALKANPDWRRQFVLSMMDMINNDFTEERMSALLEDFGADISWHEYFFRDRPDNMIAFTAKEFGLQNATGELTVTTEFPERGNVRVNTSVIDLAKGSWTGRYFREYPVTLTATPNPGYRFVGWSDGRTDAAIEVQINGGVTVNAVFEKE